MGKTIKKVFTEDELKQVVEEYKSGISTRILARKYKTQDKNIKKILFSYGIDINDPNCQYAKHKPCGYWASKEHCEEAAKQCRNRREFYSKFVRAAMISKKNGWMNEFDKYFSPEKMFFRYNDPIHYVYAYEINETHAVYVGRTSNIKRRHTEHMSGVMYTNHKVYNDTLKVYCDERNIEMPDPKILEEKLVAIESQRKEKEWIDWYRRHGWTILNKASVGEGSGSLGSIMRKWDYEACRAAAEQCESKADYRRKFSTACRVATQNKWINDFFTNLIKPKFHLDSFDNCMEEVKKYKSLQEARADYPFLYHKICQHKWNDAARAVITENNKKNGVV